MELLKKNIFINREGGIWQSGYTIFGNIVGQSFSALALIIITRLLGPEQFGVFSVGLSLVLILVRINELGLNTPILKFASSSNNFHEKNKIYSLTLKYKLLFSIILIFIGIFFAKLIASFIGINNSSLIMIAFTMGLATTYYEHLLTILQSLHFFSKAVLINIIQAGIKLTLAITLFLLSQFSVVPIFSLYIVAPIVPVLFFNKFLPTNFHINFQAKDPILQQKIKQLAKHSSIAFICAGIIENIDVLFLQRHLSSYEAGLYAGSARIALLFSLVAYSLANVLNPRVARYKTKAQLRSYLSKSWVLILLVVIGFLLFLPFAKTLLLLTIGTEYSSGLPVLIILSAASFLTIASVPFIALFYSYNFNWYFSLSGIIQLLIVLSGNYFYVPIYGLEASAWTRVIARIFLLIFTAGLGSVLLWKNYDKKFNKA